MCIVSKSMLLFSDLHLSVKTYKTSMQVLRHVHDQAKQHNTSVGFLGDFFDHVYNKGTLPVNILNELMRFFETEWSVPMIMIPGNHDYFDASETEHGLTPFKYASKWITVLDNPTVINRQLWVPWRRCNDKLHQILQQHTDVDVIFGHFDIVGFKLNPTKLSTEGLSQSVFPKDIPIYTGHYHTPQVYQNIRYLGSPYQLSLSEAEDKKSLIIIDTQFVVKKQLPLDIGPRQYKWSAKELLGRHDCLRKMDRVVVTATATDNLLSMVTQLEARGVAVHVKKKIEPSVTRIEQHTSLTPQQLFQNYGTRLNIDKGSRAWQLGEQWVTSIRPQLIQKSADVRPTKIAITGFGPFKGQVTLALERQGFTLISGECNESKNASNGAGKSMLSAGAWLWACTGMIDGRGTVSFGGAVLHNDADKAQVTVTGFVEGRPWSISRILCRTKKACSQKIQLTIDNKDCTRSTVSGTQKAIASEIFGLDMTASALHSWLLRNSVWTQMSVPRWLDASDTQAKHDISPFANMDCWLGLCDKAKVEYKTAKCNVQQVEQEITMKTHQRDCAVIYYEKQVQETKTWHAKQSKRLETATSELSQAQSKIMAQPFKPAVVSNLKSLRADIECKRKQIAIDTARKELLPPMVETLPALQDVAHSLGQKDHCTRERYTAVHALKQWEHDLRHFNASGECASCHRPFAVDNNRKQKLEQQVIDGQKQLAFVTDRLSDAQRKYEAAVNVEKQHDDAQKSIQLANNIEKNTTDFQMLIGQLEQAEKNERQLRDYQLLQEKYEHSLQLANAAAQNLQRIQNDPCPFTASPTAVQQADNELVKLNHRKQQRQEQEEIMKALLGWVGPRGIQTYAMEYAVQKLAALTTVWLQRFFKTDDIELKVHFDSKERLVRQVVCPNHAGVMSGGQWRRAQLASFMAWREMSATEFPLLIMDEACTSMDQAGISSVQGTLKDWCEENDRRTCLFITHESTQHRDTSIYNNHVRILHKRGRSSLVEQTPRKRQKM
tara:strand:+ start:10765 stop:13776 length:3012 start_codon:yes stop_codon:yes gene_type:complete